MSPRLRVFGFVLEKLVAGLQIDEGVSTIAHELLHLIIDAAGKIVSTGTFFGTVLKIDEVTGAILSVLDTLVQPTGIAIASNGDIYVADFTDGTLNRYPLGAGPKQIVGTIPLGFGANYVTLNDSENRAYVNAAFANTGLYEFDISNPGLFPVVPVTKFGASAAHNFLGMAFAPGSDTQLYIGNASGNLQLVPDVTLAVPTLTTVAGPVGATSMAFRGADLWMIDIADVVNFGTAKSGKIQIFDPVLLTLTVEAKLPDSAGLTEGFVLDASGDAYMVGVEESRLIKYTVSTKSFSTIRNPEVNSPADIALRPLADDNAKVYVQDFAKIAIVNGENGERTGIVPTVVGGNFNIFQPQSAAAEGLTVLNASWAGLGLLRLINPETLAILFQSTQLPGNLIANGDFLDTLNFVGIAYDFGFVNPEVYRLPRDNSAAVIIPSTVVQPVGLLVVPNTNGSDLYVSDYSANKIVQLMDDGTNVNVDRVTGLDNPKGLWLDNHDKRFGYVFEVPSVGVGRITRWNLSNGAKELVMDNIPSGNRDPAPASMAPWFQLDSGICDAKGGIFFNASATNEIWAARLSICGQPQL